MPTSDEDLAALADTVEKRRQQLEDARAKRLAAEQSVVNDITANALKEELRRLDAALAEEQARNKVTVVRDAAPTTDAAQVMADAAAAADAEKAAAKAATATDKG